MSPESQRLLEKLEKEYPLGTFTPTRGSAKTTIEWWKTLEYIFARVYISRLQNGENLTDANWQEMKNTICAYVFGDLEVDDSFKKEIHDAFGD